MRNIFIVGCMDNQKVCLHKKICVINMRKTDEVSPRGNSFEEKKIVQKV